MKNEKPTDDSKSKASKESKSAAPTKTAKKGDAKTTAAKAKK